jgi:mannitol-1-/sugar-/sorbitol-6-phosphatase
VIEFVCRGLLIDIDGTLVNSLPAVDRCWGAWARRHDMDPDWVIARVHGRRSIDSIRLLRPDLDAEAEDALLRASEAADTEGVLPIPGALRLVGCLPPEAFAVVTSGTRDVAHARLRAVGIPVPAVGVYGEDVANGKPSPDPFLLAARQLGVQASECLVLEDTPAGVEAAKAAAMRVIGVATWKTSDDLAAADAVVDDLERVVVMPLGGGYLKITIR